MKKLVKQTAPTVCSERDANRKNIIKTERAEDEWSFAVENDRLFKSQPGRKIPIANFYLTIKSQKLRTDEGEIKGRMLDLTLHKNGEQLDFSLSTGDFTSGRLKNKIFEVAGASAILYGSLRDLQIATQELSEKEIPESMITTSIGFTADGCFLSKDLLITSEGRVGNNPATKIDLSGGSFSNRIGFFCPDKSILPRLGKHIFDDFINLKSHGVTFPLMGHIALAPFTSIIKDVVGKGKAALHLQGPSGSGKTFLGILAMNYFGHFDDRFVSWSSTANAIETEGWYFRDSLFLVDDYKASMTEHQTAIRVLQNHADGHGRGRLTSNSRITEPKSIRGLLLSTGEDFVSDVESVAGRTLLLQVDPEKNVRAGKKCWQNSKSYRTFLPGLISMVISKKDWKSMLRKFVEEKIQLLSADTQGLSNGLRVASNWALNWLGFEMFLDYLLCLGVIDKAKKGAMTAEYKAIVKIQLHKQIVQIQSESPVGVMFRILAQKLSSGTVSISGLYGNTPDRGKIVGIAKLPDNGTYVYPDILMEIMASHFRATGQRLPFAKNSLRDALAREGLICQGENGRWTRQVRIEGSGRSNMWLFSADDFNARCEIAD